MAASASAATYCVAPTGDDANDGSEASPFKTIAKAVAAASQAIAEGSAAAQVKVAAGEYALTNQLEITGPIVVSGAGRGQTILKRDPSVASMRIALLDHADAVLEKVTVRDGYLKTSGRAPGVWIKSGTVQDCEATNCGLAHWGADWSNGGCISLSGASARLLRTTVHGNSSSGTWSNGMAINVSGGGIVDSCLVYDNKNTNGSAQFAVYVGNGTLRNCTVVDNFQPATCAVYVDNNNGVHVYDSIVFGNKGTTATLVNTLGSGFDLAGANATALTRVSNCVFGDPVFTDGANGDYTLHPASPCVNAGQYGASSLSGYDVTGLQPRVCDGAIDVGAYECAENAEVRAMARADRVAAIEGVPFVFSLYSANAAEPEYVVDFGDGSVVTTSQTTVSHAYARMDDYTVRVSVNDSAFETVPAKAVVRPANLYLATDGSATPPYATAATAARYIEDVLPYAVDGSTVWVADGTYKFKANARVSIEAGVSVRSVSGDPNRAVFQPKTANKHRLFRLNHADAGLYGFAIEGGYNDGYQGVVVGGNVYIDALGGTVSNCVLRNVGGCKWGDAGLALAMSAGLATHLVISNLNGTSGCQKWHGVAANLTGGILANSLITDCRSGGTTAYHGGAVGVSGSAKVVNCTIAGNASGGSSGVFVDNYAPQVINTLVFNNTSSGVSDADRLVYAYPEKISGKTTVVADIRARFVNCVSTADLGATCIKTDDVKVKDAARRDYHILASSPCRDAGTQEGIDVGTTDLDGNGRVDDSGMVDVGCYEVHVSGLVASIVSTPAKTDGLAPVALACSAVVEGGEAVAYEWTVDGEVADETGSVLNRSFDAGRHTVSLRVSDGTAFYESGNTLTVNAYPKTVYVSADTGHVAAYPYDTWETAATNITQALTAGYAGASVVLAAGTYPIPETLRIDAGLTLRGASGCPEDVVLKARHRSKGDPSFMTGPVVVLNHPDAVMEGLTVEDGCARQGGNGGNLRIERLGGTATNCIIRNTATAVAWGARGGGALLLGGLVTHCVISNCLASAYGDSSDYGGGSGASIVDGVMRECLFIGNGFSGDAADGTSRFGTVRVQGGSLVNCTVVSNVARRCAGIRAESGRVVNCISSGNLFPSDPALIVSTTKEENVWTGDASLFTSCLTDTEKPINGTCLVEAAGDTFKDLALGKFAIKGTSLARDAGIEREDVPAADLAGRQRVFGKAIDIGCYEAQTSGFILIVR